MMKSIRAFFDLIKFEHTIFALPFAYLGMLLAARGWPEFHLFFWITVAMAAARTLAMGFNRIADRFWDARNPRTAMRPLVTGCCFLANGLDRHSSRRACCYSSPPGSWVRCR
jgi:4-hydroxybenzoate polyprenyltransferase